MNGVSRLSFIIVTETVLVFKATNIYEGDIYFCSAGNTSTSGTKYRTIGYKMSVKNSMGMLFRPFIIKWVEAT